MPHGRRGFSHSGGMFLRKSNGKIEFYDLPCITTGRWKEFSAGRNWEENKWIRNDAAGAI